MKKKNLLKVGLLALVSSCVVGCGAFTESQGVTETEILIGNTATTTGGFAVVGVPFNAGLNAAINAYNKDGGFGKEGKKIRLVTYDDQFTTSVGRTMTEKLIYEDKVFALVGHFGTATVSGTLDLIEESGIPMVYASTGYSGLYIEHAEGNQRAIMPVQPIYDAEGRVLLARALSKSENSLAGTKVGVIYTNDDAGKGMLNGVKLEATSLGLVEGTDIVYAETTTSETDHTSVVNQIKNAGCDVVIVAANQIPFLSIMGAFPTAGYDNVKVITSYVSASAATAQALTLGGVLTETRKVYATAWLATGDAEYKFKPTEAGKAKNLYDVYNAMLSGALDLIGGYAGLSEEYWEFAVDMYDWGVTDGNDTANGFLYTANSYAMAGYIAGKMFIAGLDRIEEDGKVLNWNNYINAMESAPVSVPMGGAVDYAEGSRVGIQDLALNELTSGLDATTGAAGTLVEVSKITSIQAVREGISK